MNANKEMAERWLRAVGGGDTDSMRALMTEDAVWQLMGTSVLAGERDVDGLVELAGLLHSAMKDGIEFEFLNFTAEDDRVAVEFRGKSELVTGGSYNNVYHLLFHFRDGKVCHVKEYTDSKIIDAAVGPLLAGAEG
jgi:ketosteroid isomerase-like protein